MEIKILGTGCSNCKNLEKATREAVAELNLDATVVKEEDIVKIMSYGIMRTPALVLDEKVLFYGRVPSVTEIKEMLIKK
jgi:small redox-active disulfide protein 2